MLRAALLACLVCQPCLSTTVLLNARMLCSALIHSSSRPLPDSRRPSHHLHAPVICMSAYAGREIWLAGFHNVPLLLPVPLLTLSNPLARELVKVPLRREALVGQVVTSTVLPAPAYLGSQSSFTWIPSPFPCLLPPRLLYPPLSHHGRPTPARNVRRRQGTPPNPPAQETR
jgi:hypothetical protein